MNATHRGFSPRSRISGESWLQRGFSMIELMVAMTIGLLIVAALLALFVNITRTNDEMAKANSQIENGRFAIQLLQNDLVHAGFWGEWTPDGAAAAAVPDPCLAFSTSAPWTPAQKSDFIRVPVQGYGATPPSGAGCVTNFSTNRQPNTDILVIRHAETCLPGAANCEADTPGKLYIQSALCAAEITPVVFPPVLDTTGFNLHKLNCTTVADKRKFISNIYYVRNWAATVGDGIPTLMRSSFDRSPGGGGILAHQAAQPLIEGIEAFHVEYGIDTSGDGSPDSYSSTPPTTAADLSNVVAVKVYVLARNLRATPGYIDSKSYQLGATTFTVPSADVGFRRHVFSSTIRLVNPSGRRGA
jgi:type IV pilus assembly protein PilW